MYRTTITTNRNRTRTLAVVTAVALSAVALGACGDDDDDSVAAESPVPTTQPAATQPSSGDPSTTVADATMPADAPTIEPGGTIDVTAVDFHFMGMPTQLAAGSYQLTFSNEGTEEHEIAIFKNPEGLTLEELYAMGPEEGPKHVEMTGMLFAPPGQQAEAPATIELTPGEYLVTCFIPTPSDNKPHFMHGMQQTISVD